MMSKYKQFPDRNIEDLRGYPGGTLLKKNI